MMHKAAVHDIDVVYYLCGVDKCVYKGKTADHVRRHKANVHDIDVVYYLCGNINNTLLHNLTRH